MSANHTMKSKSKTVALSRRYLAALRRHLSQSAPDTLEPAVKLGQQAVAIGLETLDLALIHERALLSCSQSAKSLRNSDCIIEKAGAFFVEAIQPIEVTHRSALESNIRLNRMNRELNQRTMELAASNQSLKGSIAKRKAVEQALRSKEKLSTQLLDRSNLLQEQLRQLSRQMLLTQEEERKRISRELHDVIAQMLTGINIRLETLRTEAAISTSGLTKNILRTQRLVEMSVDVVHRFARELRPAMLDDLGLIPALYSYMTDFTKRTGVRVSLTAFAGVEKLSNARRTALYRVALEALTNIGSHAKASSGSVTIEKLGDNVRMQIKDNGKSFSIERFLRSKRSLSHGLGLLGMRERAEMLGGSLTVESDLGKGTTIQMLIPFNDSARKP